MNRLFLILILTLISCTGKTPWFSGEDKDRNGVRDDLDQWIVEKSKGNTKLRKGLEDLARTNPADCEYSIRAKCLDQLSEDSMLLQIELLDLQLNTNELRQNFQDSVKHCPKIDERKINYKCRL